MNTVRFNEALDDVIKDKKTDTSSLLRCMLSPLIDWENKHTELDFTNPDTHRYANDVGAPRLPFSEFRINATWGQHKIKLWVNVLDSGLHDIMFHHSEVPDEIVHYKIKFLQIRNSNENPIDIESWFRVFKRGKWFSLIKEEYKEPFWIIGILYFLASDFLNPHLFFCKVSPPKNKVRSIIWQRQREHFVFVHKTHSANKKEHFGKQLVCDGPTIDRAAHSRRAHYRMLRSPRFKNKQGQKIWIKSMWVGPKEWKDRSGQIYKIVEDIAKPSNN